MTLKEAYDIVDKLIDYYIENIEPERPNEDFDNVNWDDVALSLRKAVKTRELIENVWCKMHDGCITDEVK